MIENKIDVAPIFDYDFDKAEQRARALNPKIQCFRLSSLKGDGFEAWVDWLHKEIEEWRKR